MIAIIDYDMGNIHSVQKALEALGGQVIVAQTPEDIAASDKLVLPGVGAFDDAVKALVQKKLIPALLEHIKKGKIFLGICLGMQLLFEGSQEAEEEKGLGVLKGRVNRFDGASGQKVPHMGWNQLTQGPVKIPLLRGVSDGEYVYFCHSYYPAPEQARTVTATTEYGVRFASVVWQGNVYGVQFHPEKSQDVGIRILKNFIAL